MSRTETQELPPVVQQEGATSSTPTHEDQIRSYRRSQRLRYEAARRVPRAIRRNYRRSLESYLDPEQELDMSQRRRANLVPAERLYTTAWSDPSQRVYQHYSEERILVTGEGEQLDLGFINRRSYDLLLREGTEHIHLGLLMIRVHGLHRREAGTNVLIVLRDTRWGGDDRSIIGTMEIDMSRGTQLVYLAPNMMLSIHDFYRHIQLSIQARGYESWVGL
ncbi:hypothetical protein Tsubulata_028691 [Turnera subulata]|uniref:Polyprotein n=1 Tax=Turnera subulata TaxID=218843 RepID=A0A9Q0GHU2_9ROSI|nr:hypothetical protein Tsubulata_028691 [Turnera subulata]